MTTKVILIRHGETNWNKELKYCGFSDIDLNQTGILQAKKLSEKLEGEKIDNVYSSNMKRTRNFAKLSLDKKIINEIPGFREYNFGAIEGLTHKQAMGKFGRIYSNWIDDPFNNEIPGAERMDEFIFRVRSSLSKVLLNHHGQTIVIYLHAGPIRIILSDTLNQDVKKNFQIKQDSANISIINFNEKKGFIVSQNDTSYLYNT